LDAVKTNVHACAGFAKPLVWRNGSPFVEYVNVNGLIQSGREQYTLTIGQATIDEIADIKASGATASWFATTSSGFTVRYDVANDRIQVEELKVAGARCRDRGQCNLYRQWRDPRARRLFRRSDREQHQLQHCHKAA